jgi:hypothetical protein
MERFKEQTRDARSTRSMENVLSDLRIASRRLRQSPSFSILTVLTLALGIGATTAIFSVVSGVLLGPLPYDEAENLVYINTYFLPESGFDFAEYAVGSPEYFDDEDANTAMEEVAAVSTEAVTITAGRGDPEVVRAGWVSPSMFTVLRTPPLLGRTLLTLFAGVALTLGAIGIYGVIPYGVALRAGEIGIRRALGAEEREVMAMVLIQGLGLTGTGLALGLAGAFAGTRILTGFLHGASPTDPLTYLAVAGITLGVAALASFFPARRAGGVDPLAALRGE